MIGNVAVDREGSLYGITSTKAIKTDQIRQGVKVVMGTTGDDICPKQLYFTTSHSWAPALALCSGGAMGLLSQESDSWPRFAKFSLRPNTCKRFCQTQFPNWGRNYSFRCWAARLNYQNSRPLEKCSLLALHKDGSPSASSVVSVPSQMPNIDKLHSQ